MTASNIYQHIIKMPPYEYGNYLYKIINFRLHTHLPAANELTTIIISITTQSLT